MWQYIDTNGHVLLPIHPDPCPPLSGTNSECRFRTKYHPDEASRLKAETQSALNNRLNVFTFLMENGWFDNVSLDIDQTPAIIKVLDAGEMQFRWNNEVKITAVAHKNQGREGVCNHSLWNSM